MTPYRHLISSISLGWITANLVFWCVPLTTVVLLGLALPPLRATTDKLIDRIYRAAVHVDSFWLIHVLGLHIRTHGEPPPVGPQQLLLVSNHRSWFDILVIQHIITGRGPIIKFLIKRQLIFVPVVGWICLALNFPRLYRGTSDTGRQQDFLSIQRASQQLTQSPYALLNFAEGTRFSQKKRELLGSEYVHLLNPKAGGLRIIMDSLESVDVMDMTLVYPNEDISFWRMLSGNVKQVDVYLRRSPSTEIRDAAEWLKGRWREKDALIESARQ